jgi:hypothetical protein
VPPPNFSEVGVLPDTIAKGGVAVISWRCNDTCHAARIEGLGDFAGDTGSVEVRPTRTTRYTVRALLGVDRSYGGTVLLKVTVIK